MRKFFTVSDDFFYIIKCLFPKSKKPRLISTGWTNFVFCVKTKGKQYVFRFPRNEFFANALVKECKVCAFLREQNLGFEIPDLQLRFHRGRPFSFHEKIRGKALSTLRLTKGQKKGLAQSVCKFLCALQSVQVPFKLPLCSEFLSDLSQVSGGEYDLAKHIPLKESEQRALVLSHGDFNSGNIIMRHKKMVGVIDFAFVSLSSFENDIARLIGRLDQSYEPVIKREFQSAFKGANSAEIDRLKSVWEYVDQKYIEHIKSAHPEINLSKK